MAVYRRNYKPYAGALTPEWSRCLVLFRYSRRNLFRSKFLTGLFVVCFFYPLVCLAMIYLAHNASFLEQVGVPSRRALHRQQFLFQFHERAGHVGVSADRLCRAGTDFARSCQWSAAAIFLPSVSRGLNMCWAKRRCWQFCFRKSPGCRDWFSSSCKRASPGRSWTWNHLWIAGSLILSSLIWIAILSLLAMALSAWVKWRIVAGALLLGVMFFGAGFAQSDQRRAANRVGPLFQHCLLMAIGVECAISDRQRSIRFRSPKRG